AINCSDNFMISQIVSKFATLGWGGTPETPTAQVTSDNRGCYQYWDNSPASNRYGIYVSGHTSASEVHGLILQKWTSIGAEGSSLGYPVTDETDVPGTNGARFNNFDSGVICWTPTTN